MNSFIKCIEVRNNDEIKTWNTKLKSTNASFFQYPYYASGYKSFAFCNPVYLKFIDDQNFEKAFCVIIKIGFFPLKIGLIIRGPVIIDNTFPAGKIIDSLTSYAEKHNYIFLRLNPDTFTVEAILKANNNFIQKNFFPAYKGSQNKNFNVHKVSEENLLSAFRRDCRHKIKYADEMNFNFESVTKESELKNVYELFKIVGTQKNFKHRPYKSYKEIFLNGFKANLCSVYTARLQNRIVCAAFVVKDAQAFTYFSGALDLREIKSKNSPANKLQYIIMKDCFYKEDKSKYNISYSSPGSSVYMFKDSFHPKVEDKPEYFTYVINKKISNFIFNLQKSKSFNLKKFLRQIINFHK